jgi:hypothetical protein
MQFEIFGLATADCRPLLNREDPKASLFPVGFETLPTPTADWQLATGDWPLSCRGSIPIHNITDL